MPKRSAKSAVVRVARPSATRPSATSSSSTTTTIEYTDDGVAKIDIASLTLDTPLQPFRRPAPPPPPKTFSFLGLPSELRLKIYAYYFDDYEDEVIDLASDNYKRYHKRLGIVRVCRQVHDEVTHYFYSTRPFRVFPTDQSGRHFKSKRPLLARLKPVQRRCITHLELRLGPGWNAPPRGWAVNPALGLHDCVNVKTLRIFIQFDPSDGFCKDFRRSDGFYEGFSRTLLRSVLDEIPSVKLVEFDAWPGVKKKGAMMVNMMEIIADAGLPICWGVERGWTDSMEDDEEPSAGPTQFLSISEYAALQAAWA